MRALTCLFASLAVLSMLSTGASAQVMDDPAALLEGTAPVSDKPSGGVSPSPYKLFEVGGLPVTNSMVTSWVVSLLIILVVQRLVRRPKLVPPRGQALVEVVVDGVRNLVEPIVGQRMVRPTFWLLAGLFLFILIHNWSGLIPGVGAFGYYDADGKFIYFQRPGNADLNMTLALAIVVQICWLYYVLRYAGIKTLLYDWFGNKADKKDVGIYIFILLTPIFFVVGMIEFISWAFRLVSLSFRLYGNVFGGENLLDGMTNLIPALPILIPVPFYFLELLIGLVQALVFTLLTAVYIGLICNHEGGHEEHAH